MSYDKKINVKKETSEYKLPNITRLTTPSCKLRSKTEEKLLFDARDLEIRSHNFDIINPASGDSDILLESQNSSLYAFRNSASHLGNRTQLKKFGQVGSKATIGRSSALIKIPKPVSNNSKTKASVLEKIRAKNEVEKLSIDFKEDPFAYFSKRKDGGGHRFIYMTYKYDPEDPSFSPYELKKVAFSECNKEYFMMTATGITHYSQDGSTETISLGSWSQEISVFNSIRKIKFFSLYFYWKSFKVWRNFVVSQRYNQVATSVLFRPCFRNPIYFSNLSFVNNELQVPKRLLEKYLLSFNTHAMFKLDMYLDQNRYNYRKLKVQYTDYINGMLRMVLDLYSHISDPKLVQVFDVDFPEVKRNTPNLSQIVILEKKKAASRAFKTDSVNQDITSLGGFIRIVDYMILETLVDQCIKCWRRALSIVQEDMSCVFQVEVYYTPDGDVFLKPTKSELLNAVANSLQESLSNLDGFPRLLNQSSLLPYLRDNGLNLKLLLTKGPQFTHIIRCFDELQHIQESIIKVLETSYDQAFFYSQMFRDYFPIYKLAETWNPRSYLITRSGKQYTGDLSDTARDYFSDKFVSSFDDEPIVDFNRVLTDIERFKRDRIRVDNLRATATKGALHIIATSLKEYMIPVLDNSSNDLKELLRQLVNMKMEIIHNALKQYIVSLQREPKALNEYVEFCELINKTSLVTPKIEEEIKFVDMVNDLLESLGLDYNKNALTQTFQQFKQGQIQAQTVKSSNYEAFLVPLKEKIQEMETSLQSYYEKIIEFPSSIENADVDTRLADARSLTEKLISLKPSIDEILYYQNTINAHISSLEIYNEVLSIANFSVDLYLALQKWNIISDTLKSNPFISVPILNLKNDVSTLFDNLSYLNTNSKTSVYILSELLSSVQEIISFLPELELLATSYMKQTNWIELFKITGNNPDSYNESITIGELINLGVLKNKDKIQEITATSRAEYEICSKFEFVNEEWQKVQMPLIDVTFRTEDTLMLGDISTLMDQIDNNISVFTNIFNNPYASIIREQVLEQLNHLENYSFIIEQWMSFQNNWTLLQPLFNQEELKQTLPQQANSIVSIQRRWSQIAKHILKDTRVVACCQYPGLKESLGEMNASLESILSSLGKFLDTKRASIPRLYFLTNDETLLFISTSNCTTFSSIVKKLFMHISHLDIHKNDNRNTVESASFLNGVNRPKVYGLVGEDGDALIFQKPVNCSLSIEQWFPLMIDSIHSVMKNLLANNINSILNNNILDRALSIPSYIMFLILNINFCDDIRSAFDSRNSLVAFKDVDSHLNKRLEYLSSKYKHNELEPSQFEKLSLLMIIIINFRDIVKKITNTRIPSEVEWNRQIKFSYQSTNSSVVVEFFDQQYEHGLEFWGKIPRLILTQSVHDAVYSLSESLIGENPSVLIGSAKSGKKYILSTMAALLGRFIYTYKAIPGSNNSLIIRALIGAVASGSWINFSSIDEIDFQSLSVLYDAVRMVISAQAAGNSRVTLNNKHIDIHKTAKIFMTSSPKYSSSNEIPQQLKSFMRAIALSTPHHEKICAIKLCIRGFKNSDKIASCLVSFVNSVSKYFVNPFCRCSHMQHYDSIIDRAQKYLIKTNTEDMAVAFSSMIQFAPFCTLNLRSTLFDILYSSFPIVQSTDDFEHRFDRIRDDSSISDHFTREIQLLQEVPSEYMSRQCLEMFRMLNMYQCIIVVGPPNSGKTTAFNIVKNAVSQASFREIAPSELPLEVKRIYHESDTTADIFGSVLEDKDFGFTVTYGVSDSAIFSFNRNGEKRRNIIYYDGKLTKELVAYLNRIIQEEKPFPYQFVIECDNINNATQTLISKCGILVMRNVQSETSLSLLQREWNLVHPLLPLSNAMCCISDINESKFDIFRSVFCELAPLFVKKIHQMDNHIQPNGSNLGIVDGSVLISERLPSFAAFLAVKTLIEKRCNIEERNDCVFALLISLLHVFAGIIKPNKYQALEAWTNSLCEINVPLDWSKYYLPKIFIEDFANPDLYHMRLYNSELTPVCTEHLESEPIFRSTVEFEVPSCSSEVTVVHPSCLFALQTAKTFLHYGKHIIIHGKRGCGKTSLVNMIFHKHENLIRPIYIQSSSALTSEVIIRTIETHTTLLSTTVSPEIANIMYILIFDNVGRNDVMVMEFIRSIINTEEIPIFSRSNQKCYDIVKLRKFCVIVTTSEYSFLPVRFLSLLVPVQVTDMSLNSASYVFQKTLQLFGMSVQNSEFMVSVLINIFQKFPKNTLQQDIISCMKVICNITNNNDPMSLAAAIISSATYVSLQFMSQQDYIKSFSEILSNSVESSEVMTILESMIKGDSSLIGCRESSNGKYMNRVTFTSTSYSQLNKDIVAVQNLYNSQSTDKISLIFSDIALKQFALLNVILSIPGANAIVVGRSGSGRYSMTRLISHMNECDFVYLTSPTQEEAHIQNKRGDLIASVIKDVINNTAVLSKRTIVFCRYEDDTVDDCNTLMSFVSDLDFVRFFSLEELDALYTNFLHSQHTEMNFNLRMETQRRIQRFIRANLTLVIAANEIDMSTVPSIMTIINYDIPGADMDEAISLNFISSNMPEIDKVFSNQIGKVFHAINERMVNDLGKLYNSNMFLDFLHIFKHISELQLKEIGITEHNINSSIKFIDKLEKDSVEIDQKVKDLEPQVNEIKANAESLTHSYNTRKEAIEIRKMRLISDKEDKEKQYKKTKQSYDDLLLEINSLKHQLLNAANKVEHINENDIETIRIASDQPTLSFTLLIKILCILMELPKPYENSGKDLLKELDFIEILKTRINVEKITKQMIQDVEPLLTDEKMNPRELELNCSPMRSIYDWICEMLLYAKLDLKVQDAKRALDDETIHLNEFMEEINLEMTSIQQVESTLQTELDNLNNASYSREKMDSEYANATTIKGRIDQVKNDINLLREKWCENRNEFELKRKQLMGDSITYAFYVVFGGIIPHEKRGKIFHWIQSLINDNELEYSYNDPLKFVGDRLAVNSELNNLSFNLPESAQMDARLVYAALRTPLLIDPDGIVCQIIIDSIEPKKLIVISQNSTDVESSLISAIECGKTLILLDVDRIHPVIGDIMSFNYRDETATREVRIGQKVVHWDIKFKLILVSNSLSTHTLPLSLLSRVTVIDTTSSSSLTIHELFVSTFLHFFAPTLSPQLAELHKKEHGHRVLLKKYERAILDILSDIMTTIETTEDYDYINDKETIDDLIKSKECYFSYVEDTPDSSDLMNKLENTIKPFQQLVRLCQIFWTVLTRYIVRVNPGLRFQFSEYQKLISTLFSNEGFHPGTLSADQLTLLRSAIINSTFQYFFPSLTISEIQLFTFVSAFFVRESEGKVNSEDLDKVLSHISALNMDQCDFSNCEPNDVGSLDAFQYTNILNVSNYVSDFVKSVFGSFYIPTFHIDSIISNSGLVPTIITCGQEYDPTHMILKFASQRCRYENFNVISLTDDIELLKYARKTIQADMTKGNWVLLHYSKPNRSAAALITDILQSITTTSVNNNFRIIIICRDTQYIAPSALIKSRRYAINNTPTIRNIVMQLITHYSSYITSSVNPRAAKKLAYLSSQIYALTYYRNLMSPLGFSSRVYPSDYSFMALLKHIKTILDTSASPLPAESTAEILKSFFFQSVTCDSDKKIASYIIDKSFSSKCLADGYSIVEKSDNEIWSLPSDIPLSSFPQHILKLPLYPPAEAYGIDSKAANLLINYVESSILVQTLSPFKIPKRQAARDVVLSKIEGLSVLIPELIPLPPEEATKGPLGFFLLSEIEKFNHSIVYIQKSLRKIRCAAEENIFIHDSLLIAYSHTPKSWKVVSKNFSAENTSKFVTNLIERHAQLTTWCKGSTPQTFDVTMYDDIKHLLLAFMDQVAISLGRPVSSLTYEFSTTAEATNNSIILKRVQLLLGNFDDNGHIVSIDPSEKCPFKSIPKIVCTVVPKEDHKHVNCIIPLYNMATGSIFNCPEFEIVDGDTSNHILNMEFRCDKDCKLYECGTAMFCKLSSQFTSY